MEENDLQEQSSSSSNTSNTSQIIICNDGNEDCVQHPIFTGVSHEETLEVIETTVVDYNEGINGVYIVMTEGNDLTAIDGVPKAVQLQTEGMKENEETGSENFAKDSDEGTIQEKESTAEGVVKKKNVEGLQPRKPQKRENFVVNIVGKHSSNLMCSVFILGSTRVNDRYKLFAFYFLIVLLSLFHAILFSFGSKFSINVNYVV